MGIYFFFIYSYLYTVIVLYIFENMLYDWFWFQSKAMLHFDAACVQ